MFKEINNYALLKLLGRGAFGEVHLAESVDKDLYALKIITVTNENKDDAQKEARMYVSFEHPNIVNAREFFFFEKEQYLIIILEYCLDGSLLNLIGKIDQSKCKEIMKKIAQGLIYLHDEKKTLHRDIKLENILMLNGVPKIADLGIAKAMKTEGLQTRICTIFYASPEVLNEENYDFSADIWSLGIVFLELLSGKRITDLVKGKLPPGFRSDFPSEELLNQIKDESLRDLVRRMLEKDPKKRLKAKQVLEELKGNKIKVPNKNTRRDLRKSLENISEKQFIDLLLEDVQFPNLTYFKLQGCKITDKALKILATIPSLKEKLPNLQYIYLRNNQITDAGLKALAEVVGEFKNLQRIWLSNNQITDAGLKALAEAAGEFKNLQWIGFDNNQITDAGLKALVEAAGKFKNLKAIGFDNNKITDAGLKALAGAAGEFENLQTIYFGNNEITDVGLKALAEAAGEFKNLQGIYLDDNQITDEGLKVLAGAVSEFNNLQEIYLGNNQITDVGLKALAAAAGEFKNLKAIGLSSNQITDVALKELAEAAEKLKNLQRIYLANTKVTKKAVDAIIKEYKIKFSIAC